MTQAAREQGKPPVVPGKETVIAIHGVGDPAPGALLTQILAGIDPEEALKVSRDRFTLDGPSGTQRYETARIEGHGQVGGLIEVNWSDVRRAPRGPISLILFVLRLMLTMMWIGATGWNRASEALGAPSFFGHAFRIFVASAGFWVIGLPLIGLHMSVAPTFEGQVTALGLVTLLTGVTAFVTGRIDPWFRMGWLWFVINGCASAGLILMPDALPSYVVWTTRIAGIAQITGLVLVLAAFFELLVRIALGRHQGMPVGLPFLVRMACLYMPLIVLTAFNGLIFAVNLSPYYLFGPDLPLAFRDWVAAFQDSQIAGRTLRQVVFAAGGLFASFLLVRGLVPFAFSLKRAGEGDAPPAGRSFQDQVAVSLALIPAVLIPLGLLGILEIFGFGILPDALTFGVQTASIGGEGAELTFNVFALSALTVLVFVPLLIGPGRTVLDVTGDVAFYIAPPPLPAATAETLRGRVDALLSHLAERYPGEKFVLTGYSLGSVIAADALRDTPAFRGRLVTVGSPIDSLFRRFLCIPVGFTGPAPRPAEWLNLFRPTDFVGGPIGKQTGGGDGADRDIPVRGNPASHHLRYWSEPEVVSALVSGSKGPDAEQAP